MNIFGCVFLSCLSALCLNMCCRACSQKKPEETANLIEKKLDEVIDTYEHTSTEETIICPITQDKVELGTIIKELPCGHKFSEDIDKWLSQKNRCPVCRGKVIII